MVKMIQDIGKIMEKVQEMFNKDSEELNQKKKAKIFWGDKIER